MRDFFGRYKWKLCAVLVAAVLLSCGLALDDFSRPETGRTVSQESGAEKIPAPQDAAASKETVQSEEKTEPQADGNDSVSAAEPKPTVSQESAQPEEKLRCIVSISCGTILDNMALCDENKRGLVPADGWILSPVEVSFDEGESVFDVLKRIARDRKIHVEFEYTPGYDSAYIEGISNLYEFDVGECSGWMYSVNGWFPNYGCSLYKLKDGDRICWVYTCNLGSDVGGKFAKGE